MKFKTKPTDRPIEKELKKRNIRPNSIEDAALRIRRGLVRL